MALQFSDAPCNTCGWRHQVDAFNPRDRVCILAHRSHAPPFADDPNRVGQVGVVLEWRAWPKNSVWVRVQFADGERENFDPCELELERVPPAYNHTRDDSPLTPCPLCVCPHDVTKRGNDVPRIYGSWRTEVCLACQAFRTRGHPPGSGKFADHTAPGPWRPHSEYDHATRARGDDE